MAKLDELHFELLPHLPYSPNLAPSDYWLFADLKRMLQRKRLGSNEEVISETEAHFESVHKYFNKKASSCNRSVGISVSPEKETTLMNKVEFCPKVVALLVRLGQDLLSDVLKTIINSRNLTMYDQYYRHVC